MDSGFIRASVRHGITSAMVDGWHGGGMVGSDWNLVWVEGSLF